MKAPGDPVIGDGDEVWWRLHFKLASGWSWNAVTGVCEVKFMRWFRNEASGATDGTLSIMIMRGDSCPTQALGTVNVKIEGFGGGYQSTSGTVLENDKWYTMEMYWKLNSAGQGIARVWLDGQPIYERTGFSSIQPNGYLREAQFGGAWNNGGPGSTPQTLYIDDITVTTDPGVASQIDSQGNKYLGLLNPSDTTPPSVAITTPPNGATVSTTVTISATSSDNVGVVGVQFKLDEANLQAEDTSAPYSILWDTATAVNGSHALTAVARDAAGNTTTSTAVSVTVDNNNPPTVSITAPLDGATVSSTVTVSATSSDNVGVVGVQFKLDAANLGQEDTTTPYSVNWYTIATPDGTHTLTAVARDSDGNLGASSPITVTVKNTQSDNFERATLGSNWTTFGSSSVAIVNSSDIGLATAGPGISGAEWNADIFLGDQFSEAVISPDKDPNLMAQVFVRRRNDGTARYSCMYNLNTTPEQWQLSISGTSPVIITTSTFPGPQAGDTLSIVAGGSFIRCYLNGAEVLNAPNSTLTMGRPGVAFAPKQGSTITYPTPVFESWYGGNLATTSLSSPAIRVPLNDLGSGTYLGFQSGLYENGLNSVPADHDTVGLARNSAIQPLDTNGNASSTGKVVLLGMGMSNTTQEWCSASGSLPCDSWTFTGQASSSPSVNTSTLVIANGALGSQTAMTWSEPYATVSNAITPRINNYDRVRDNVLTPQGLSEKQVQAIWLKVAQISPIVGLPTKFADAYSLETALGKIVRAAKIRYPNLQIIFLSSRIYGGYATVPLNPEPYAYESGLAYKWLIQAQIDQMRNGGTVVDTRAGNLNYNTGVAPWLVWSAYPWANGTIPRSDGLTWISSELEADGTHPSQTGEQKFGTMLLNYFLASPYATWFRP